MGDWIRLALDLVLIACVSAGLIQATRLMRHLSNLQQGREDMERFVREFNATVSRAETGIKELRYAARESGDDLEKLVDKAAMVREELQFLVESADQIAERLSQSATRAVQSNEREAEIIPIKELQKEGMKQTAAPQAAAPTESKPEPRQVGTKQAQPMPRRAASSSAESTSSASAAAPNAAALSSLAAKIADARAASKVSPAAASRAEQELLQALQNLR